MYKKERTEQNDAAVKLQARFRGFKARARITTEDTGDRYRVNLEPDSKAKKPNLEMQKSHKSKTTTLMRPRFSARLRQQNCQSQIRAKLPLLIASVWIIILTKGNHNRVIAGQKRKRNGARKGKSINGRMQTGIASVIVTPSTKLSLLNPQRVRLGLPLNQRDGISKVAVYVSC